MLQLSYSLTVHHYYLRSKQVLFLSGVCPCMCLCVCLSALKSDKHCWSELMQLDRNMCYGEPWKWLDFGDIWPCCIGLTLGAIFVLLNKETAYNLNTAGHMVMYLSCFYKSNKRDIFDLDLRPWDLKQRASFSSPKTKLNNVIISGTQLNRQCQRYYRLPDVSRESLKFYPWTFFFLSIHRAQQLRSGRPSNVFWRFGCR